MAEPHRSPPFGSSQDLLEPSPGKRQRKLSDRAHRSPVLAPAAQNSSPVLLAPQQWAQDGSGQPPGPQEAGGSNEATLAAAQAAAAATGGPGEAATVTDAAKAFRELRVRAPARGASPHRAGGERPGGGAERPERPSGGGGGERGGHPERPASPKKRKASYNIDKEFILKDDKVKRNTDTQGDISQARGQLGQLLFEFSQIELNRDLLEAIKRTESKTGRSGGRPPAPGRLDRAAFELAVADAAELLQAQLGAVESHSSEPALRAAILRSYAVQAIATFADEDSSSDEEDEGGGGASSSSDDENADRNSWRQQRGGSSSQDGPAAALSGDAGSQSLDMAPARPGSAAACHSPPPAGLAPYQQQQRRRGVGHLPAGGSSGIEGMASPSRPLAAASAAEQCSSSILPDAPSESALEDTATAGPRPAAAQQHGGTLAGAAGPPQPPQPAAAAAGAAVGEDAAGLDDGGGMQQRMRMLSLEAEGSVQHGQSSMAGGGEEEDGPTDMVRSPAPVTSRRLPMPPDGAQLAAMQRQESHNRQVPVGEQQQQQQQGGRRSSPGSGRMESVLEEAAGQLALDSRGGGRRSQRLSPQQARQQAQQQAAHQQQQQQQQQQGQQQGAAAAQEAEASETTSGGQASSAAAEPPKRQRRSGDLLPPLFEHSSQQRRADNMRRASDPGALAAAAAQRAAILGSVQPRPAGEWRQPAPDGGPAAAGAPPDLAPAGPQAAGGEAAAAGAGAAAAAAAAAPGGGEAEPAASGLPSDVALRPGATRAAHSGSSVWGSTLVCADLTVNDVASQYWPFLRSAMRGQARGVRAAGLQAGDKALVASLVKVLGDTIVDAYMAAAHSGRRPAAEVRSLVAATAFDDFFRAKSAAESSGAASL